MNDYGKVCIGFSKPYVALYSESSGTVSYTGGMRLARGVDVAINPETASDNTFYADNIEAERDDTFGGGTVDLTVDGLLIAAERFIMGLPAAGQDGWTDYGDDQSIPEVGLGYIAMYESDGEITYVPTVLKRVKFDQIQSSAATKGETVDWQTQSLTAQIKRAEDTNHTWKSLGDDEATEAEAEAALRTKLGITTNG